MYKPNRFFLACLFAYCVAVKVFPFALVHLGMDIRSDSVYPWSFTPLFAFGIFGVALFRDRRLAFGLPLLACLCGDLLIGIVTGMKYGLVEGFAYSLYPGQVFQYAGVLLACLCGMLVRGPNKWPGILAASLLGPSLFYLVSNFGVWAFDPGIGYPRDLSGLTQAYLAAVPFFRNQLVSTVAFSALLFSPLGMSQLRRGSASQSGAERAVLADNPVQS